MSDTAITTPKPALPWKQIVALSLLAVVSFHIAYVFDKCSLLILIYLYCFYELTQLNTDRQAFYCGLTIGMLVYAPQLYFFYTIFGVTAVALWLVLAFWLGLFLLLARRTRERCGKKIALLLIPFIWTALEYFRSELYYLRFSWLNVGYAFARENGPIFIDSFGVYGTAFMLMALMAWMDLVPKKSRLAWICVIVSVAVAMLVVLSKRTASTGHARQVVQVAGVQMEFPAQLEVPLMLDKLLQTYPETQLLVLSEYTFDGPVPQRVQDWCKKNNRHLIVGGKAPVSENQFYNTAFVIDPSGEIVFEQVKCVPIQFFKDGLSAPKQQVWDSPWGKLGICVCYDLSYTRVTDELIRQGAQALIVPTMDVVEWGEHQHQLHARVAPVRAAEYGVPVVRVCSSGISQLIDRRGRATATAPFPGEQAMIAGSIRLAESGTRPFDRWLAPLSVLVTAVLIIWLGVCGLRHRHPASNLKP